MSKRKITWFIATLLFISLFFLLSSEILAFSISSINKTEISSSEEVLEVILDLTGLPNTASYFRVAFTDDKDNPSYFGQMKNEEGDWVAITTLDQCTDYYFLESTGSGQLTIAIKMGEEREAGEYFLRGHRITLTCGSSTATDFQTIVYNPASPSPSTSPLSGTAPSTSPSSSPSTKAIYKINEVRDGFDEELSQVEIYVDDDYIRHWAPEELIFCDGCKCDVDHLVDCGFGEHTIKLEKSGYNGWSETISLSPSSNFERNVILSPQSNPAPSPSPSKSPSPSPSRLASTSPAPSASVKSSVKPSPTSSPSPSEKAEEATISGQVLGAQNEDQSAPTSVGASETGNRSGLSITKILPYVFVFFGLVLIGSAGFLVFKGRLKASEPGSVIS